jgi:hypothetical protein
MVTVAAATVLLPPAPAQVNEYAVVAESAPVLTLPLVALAPANAPPVPVQAVALVELQVSEALPPAGITDGCAVNVAPGMILTVTAALPAPPLPLQLNEYSVGTVSGPVLCELLRALAPLQPPVAVHAVALVELHVRVAAPPAAMGFGLTVRVTAAGGGVTGVTVTVAVAALLAPPAPLQVNEYVVLAVSAPLDTLPLVACAPANVPPVPVQAVALVELHVSLEAPPALTAAGLALSVAVAGGVTAVTVTVTVAGLLLPPAPLQVNEYVVVAVSAPVETLPLIAPPANVPPEPLQAVELVELQVSVVALPAVIEVWAALNDAVGGDGCGLCCVDWDCAEPELCDPPQATSSSEPKTGRKRIAAHRTPPDSSRAVQTIFGPTPLPYEYVNTNPGVVDANPGIALGVCTVAAG